MKNIIPYGKHHVTEDDINAVIEVLKSDFLTQGPKVVEFEKKFAEFIGSKYAVAVSNGTAALHLCNLALNVTKGTKVISSPLSFVATSNSVLYCGGEIEFCDIDPKTLLIDLDKLEEKLKNSPKGTYSGILPVDFAGLAVKMDDLKSLADKYGLWIIEDSCHAPGAYFRDKKNKVQNCGNGNFADLAIFSFHPVKHISCGEGGMITTNKKRLYDKLIKLRTHGIDRKEFKNQNNHGDWYYEMQTLGYNYRLSDINCALGISQLSRSESNLKIRKKIAKRYVNELKNVKEIGFYNVDQEGHAYHLFVINAQNRRSLFDYLKSKNILCQIHYIPIHLHPYYKNLGFKIGDFPIVESYYETCLSIPIFPTLEEDEVTRVINEIKRFYS